MTFNDRLFAAQDRMIASAIQRFYTDVRATRCHISTNWRYPTGLAAAVAVDDNGKPAVSSYRLNGQLCHHLIELPLRDFLTYTSGDNDYWYRYDTNEYSRE